MNRLTVPSPPPSAETSSATNGLKPKIYGKIHHAINGKTHYKSPLPIGSMVLVYLPRKLGDFVRANVGKYSIHGAYGLLLKSDIML